MRAPRVDWTHTTLALTAVWLVCMLSVVRGQAQAQAEPETIKVSGALFTDVQARRGEVIFKSYCLGGCHRENLHNGEGDLSLTGPHFLEQWGMQPLGFMVNIIRMTMPSDGPPNTLTLQQGVDVVAYVLWLNYYPDGPKELPADQNLLRRWTLQTPEEHLQMFVAIARKQQQ